MKYNVFAMKSYDIPPVGIAPYLFADWTEEQKRNIYLQARQKGTIISSREAHYNNWSSYIFLVASLTEGTFDDLDVASLYFESVDTE